MKQLLSSLLGHFKKRGQSRPAARSNRRAQLGLEALETRFCPATTATFSNGVLSVLGDAANNNIVVKATNNNLQVFDGAKQIVVQGSTPLMDATTQINIRGLAGNDKLTIDASVSNNSIKA